MKKVVIGGTFDLLHSGHKKLIEKALEEGELYVGLTSNEMAREMKKRETEDFQTRKENLKEYISKDLNREAEIEKIEDKFGFAVEKDLDCIIVSPETKENALLINQKREEVDKNPLDIIEIEFLLAEDGKPISSTRINNGEIDKEGKIIS